MHFTDREVQASIDVVKCIKKTHETFKGTKAQGAMEEARQTLLMSCVSGTEPAKGLVQTKAKILGVQTKGFRDLIIRKKKIGTGKTALSAYRLVRKVRKDETKSEDIWEKCWHNFSEVVKGRRGTRRSYIDCERVLIGNTWRLVKKMVEHPTRMQVMTVEELEIAVRNWGPCLEWKARNLEKAEVSDKILRDSKCFLLSLFFIDGVLWDSCQFWANVNLINNFS